MKSAISSRILCGLLNWCMAFLNGYWLRLSIVGRYFQNNWIHVISSSFILFSGVFFFCLLLAVYYSKDASCSIANCEPKFGVFVFLLMSWCFLLHYGMLTIIMHGNYFFSFNHCLSFHFLTRSFVVWLNVVTNLNLKSVIWKLFFFYQV